MLSTARGFQLFGDAYGSLAGLRQSVPQAELNAVLELAKRTDGDMICVVECEYLVKGYRRGPRAVHRSHADLWSQLWRALQDRAGYLRVRQVHSHATADELRSGDVDAFDYIGNEMVDKAAGMGAALNQVRASIHSYIDRTDAKAGLIQPRLVVVAMAASEASKQSRAVAAKERRANMKMSAAERQLRLERALATTRHSIVKVRSKFRCRFCRQQRVKKWAARWLEAPCKILRPLALHHSHCYVMHRGLHFCWRCGGVGSQRLRLLAEPCKPPTRAGSLVIRRMARKPPRLPRGLTAWPDEG